MHLKLFKIRPGHLALKSLYAHAVIAVLLLAAAAFSPNIYAEPPDTGNNDQIRNYCRSLDSISNKTKEACSDFDNISHLRNVAAWKCKGKEISQYADCIVKQAKKYLDQAASGKPKTAGAFTEAIDERLMDAVEDDRNKLDKPPDEAGQSLEPESTGSSSSIDPATRKDCTGSKCDFIGRYVNPAIALLSAAFGLIAVISIIIGGIQYTASAGDPQKVTEAKKRIVNTIIAIVAYFFLYGFLNFLVPGGLFNRP